MENSTQIEQLKDLLAELEHLRPLSPETEQRIWQKFRLDWNFHSNHLEGNKLTYGETKSLLLHGITAQGKPLKDHLEIRGHNQAILDLMEVVSNKTPITETLLRQYHTLILGSRYQAPAELADGTPTQRWIEVGQYKSQSNHVKTVTGEIFRFAQPHEVSVKMRDLVEIANKSFDSSFENVAHAANIHYDFVLIHPFDDGNGRMARILMNLLLIKAGLPPAIIKTEDKQDYFSALRQADGGQRDIFIEFIAAQVIRSLQIMLSGAKGEQIDEPSDIDKRLALLKATVKEKLGVLPVDRNKATDQVIINGFLKQLIDGLEVERKRFGDVYSSTSLVLSGDANRGGLERTVWIISGPEEFDKIQAKFSNHASKTITIELTFQGVKLSVEAPTRRDIIQLAFEPRELRVSFLLPERQAIVSMLYQAEPSKVVETVLARLRNVHMAWLETQFKE